MEDSGQILNSDAVQRIGEALYGKKWVGAPSRREDFLLRQYTRLCDSPAPTPGEDPIKLQYRSMLNLDQTLGSEVARACDRSLVMDAQYNHVYRWLLNHGFNWIEHDAFDRSTIERAVARDFPGAARSTQTSTTKRDP